jgi:4-azaleucine resistance transporter AzlC
MRGMKSPRNEFLSGLKNVAPILLGVIPFGMIYGALAVEVGLPPLMAQAMSFIVFAGSAQFIMAQLVGSGTALLTIFVTACLVNLRHVLYSASVAPYTTPLPRTWKWTLVYLLTDEAYAVGITGYQTADDPRRKHWYFLGAGVGLWSTWQLSTAVGVFLGGQIPASWSLDFALPLTFIVLVVPALTDRAGVAAALVAGGTAIIAASLPHNLGLIVASLAGMLVGLAVESWLSPVSPSRRTEEPAQKGDSTYG